MDPLGHEEQYLEPSLEKVPALHFIHCLCSCSTVPAGHIAQLIDLFY